MSVLSLADAKAYLNITSGDYDAELLSVISACEARIAARVGPLSPTATTSRVRGRSWDLPLPVTPVVSLTSVTPVGGTAMDVSTLYVEPESGVIEFASGFGYFPAYRYTVVYVAGRSTCPDNLLMGVKELVRLAWRPQRGNSPSSALPSDDFTPSGIPSADSDLPSTVERWLTGEIQAGFA